MKTISKTHNQHNQSTSHENTNYLAYAAFINKEVADKKDRTVLLSSNIAQRIAYQYFITNNLTESKIY